jgi:hypothetical protein
VYLYNLTIWGPVGGDIYSCTDCGTKMATTGNENVNTDSHMNSKLWKYTEANEDGSL